MTLGFNFNIMEINKGDAFICTKNMIISDMVLYVKGKIYISEEKYSLTDDIGELRMGWNNIILHTHFRKVKTGFIKRIKKLLGMAISVQPKTLLIAS